MTDSAEYLIEGITVEHRYEKRMCIVTISQFTNQHIDAWIAAVHHYWAMIPESKERYLVYDASQTKNLTMTKYLRDRSRQLSWDDRGASGRVAIVVDVSPLIRRVIQTFIQLTSRRHQPDIGIQLFDNREQAISWVEEKLQADQSRASATL